VQQKFKTFLREHYSLIGVLLGSALLSISLGPYSSWDSQLEFSAATGVVKWGWPYSTYGNMINMQPFGFYVGAVFLKIFGASYETAVAVTTVFALGCVFLTYEIGKVLYGKRTGLFAAALFALTPWHVIMSRVFLVDVQCLFFSLLYLLTGILAIRRGSSKLYFVTGLIFGFALLTKLFAVFMLIPLGLIYVFSKLKNPVRELRNVLLFVLPAFLVQYLWYEPISGRGLLSFFNHDDFGLYLPSGFAPSPFFSLSFFSEALGVFFILGFLFSLSLSFLQRKQFSKFLFFDLTCFAAIIGVVGFNFYLVFGYNMLVPYVNSIKYNYLILPMFCLLAASAAKKCSAVSKNRDVGGKRHEFIVYFAAIGPYLLLVSMIFNFMSLTTMLKYSWLTFNVPGGLSYSFDRLASVFSNTQLWGFQLLGFVLINLGLLWSNRSKLQSLFSAL
jgi:4-amino-4-deoxy-L-arabinose transferase-like glycosyltransferase